MPNRLISTAGSVVRLQVEPADADPLGRLSTLRAAEEQLSEWLVEAVAQARGEGRSWEQIGLALGVSKQAAWQLYRQRARRLLDQDRDATGLTEDEALSLAVQQTRAVRRRRGAA